MDAERFQEWFLNLLTNIPPNSTIIMDNAPYHSVQIDKVPTSANKKADLVAWLQRKGVEADMSLLKVEWLHLVKLHKPPRPTYAIDQLAEEHGHKVIRLPPYHCQYNAIELIWAQVKGYASKTQHKNHPQCPENGSLSVRKHVRKLPQSIAVPKSSRKNKENNNGRPSTEP
ncbi:hypothetical protein evm_013365 [Chilo suppressalis]|nr:hypothetical protein evm_013365 [Chilo suppressalis]